MKHPAKLTDQELTLDGFRERQEEFIERQQSENSVRLIVNLIEQALQPCNKAASPSEVVSALVVVLEGTLQQLLKLTKQQSQRGEDDGLTMERSIFSTVMLQRFVHLILSTPQRAADHVWKNGEECLTARLEATEQQMYEAWVSECKRLREALNNGELQEIRKCENCGEEHSIDKRHVQIIKGSPEDVMRHLSGMMAGEE